MVFELERIYHDRWTEGSLYLNNVLLCHTLELPWKGNKRNISCIPEGIYPLRKRSSRKYRNHLILDEVEGRDYILIHPANDALKELRGCIAPVLQLSGNGQGSYSRLALRQILKNVARGSERTHFIKILERKLYQN